MEFSIPSVAARDIDLLLLEEVAATPSFVRWFAKKAANLTLNDSPLVSARRSVTTSSGESVLDVAVADSQGAVHYLLVENKVAAGLQPKQAARYRERGNTYVRQGECATFTTVLVAPRCYLGDRPQQFGFDVMITYEDLHAWLSTRRELGNRAEVKKALLGKAIENRPEGIRQSRIGL